MASPPPSFRTLDKDATDDNIVEEDMLQDEVYENPATHDNRSFQITVVSPLPSPHLQDKTAQPMTSTSSCLITPENQANNQLRIPPSKHHPPAPLHSILNSDPPSLTNPAPEYPPQVWKGPYVVPIRGTHDRYPAARSVQKSGHLYQRQNDRCNTSIRLSQLDSNNMPARSDIQQSHSDQTKDQRIGEDILKNEQQYLSGSFHRKIHQSSTELTALSTVLQHSPAVNAPHVANATYIWAIWVLVQGISDWGTGHSKGCRSEAEDRPCVV
ncbi:hypothetical protein M422DRAFT_276821 [Sphaerobolus stellatus SS14]|uniref:Uncharacterized protein n=1 Tax=Sphaerobolus stellatus (strain SS14) TaxID=990650 RepID=A0A0C9UCA1_SPHS4|nr:hypothetical protein M422DRAFT_276821 [Sphaerobolus stellatus SS14]